MTRFSICVAAVLPMLAAPPPLADQAEAARKKGSPDAPALYQRALQTNPRWQEGWWALGTLEYQKDRYPQCRDAFRRLEQLAPESGPALAMLGLCEVGMKDYDGALDHLKHALELGAGNDAMVKTSRYHLARLYARANMFEPALGIIAQVAETEESPAWTQLAGVAALWKPMFPEDVPADDRELVFLAGKAFLHAGSRDAARAESDFEELAKRYPGSRGVHYLYGSFELRSDPDRAIAEFETELKISPSHPGALSALAAEYLRRGDFTKGLVYARKLRDLLPESLAAHALMGRLLAEKGDVAEGVRELETARDLDPSDPQPHIALASLYAKLGRTEDAARERGAFTRARSESK